MDRYMKVAGLVGLLYAKIDEEYGSNFMEMIDDKVGEKIIKRFGNELDGSV